MALPATQRLDQLTGVDPDLLYVFVAGPGQGEAIVVHAPGGAWIVVDGCRSDKKTDGTELPVQALLGKLGARVVELLVLTHPHRDHAIGIPQVVDAFRPRRVALSGCPKPGPDLAAEAIRLHGLGASADQHQRAVLGAIAAIINHTTLNGAELIPLHNGASIPFGRTIIHARSPDPTFLARLFGNGTAFQHANEISGVLEVACGSARIVLGADLPVRSSDTSAALDFGWEWVMTQHPHLHDHHGLKVPHHGSRNALHDRLLSGSAPDRAWLLSPFNSSSLPRSDDGDGLDLLLARQSPVHLTALSLSRKLTAAFSRKALTREQVQMASEQLAAGKLFQATDTIVRASSAVGPLDPIWGVAFDDRGSIVGRWAGSAAIEVFLHPPPAPSVPPPTNAARPTRRIISRR